MNCKADVSQADFNMLNWLCQASDEIIPESPVEYKRGNGDNKPLIIKKNKCFVCILGSVDIISGKIIILVKVLKVTYLGWILFHRVHYWKPLV